MLENFYGYCEAFTLRAGLALADAPLTVEAYALPLAVSLPCRTTTSVTAFPRIAMAWAWEYGEPYSRCLSRREEFHRPWRGSANRLTVEMSQTGGEVDDG